jgi:hypothetical protein
MGRRKRFLNSLLAMGLSLSLLLINATAIVGAAPKDQTDILLASVKLSTRTIPVEIKGNGQEFNIDLTNEKDATRIMGVYVRVSRDCNLIVDGATKTISIKGSTTTYLNMPVDFVSGYDDKQGIPISKLRSLSNNMVIKAQLVGATKKVDKIVVNVRFGKAVAAIVIPTEKTPGGAAIIPTTKTPVISLKTLALSGKIPTLSVGTSYKLSKLTLKGKDKMGRAVNLSGQKVVWKLSSGKKIATITSSVLDANIVGTQKIAAEINGVSSNYISFKIVK